MRFVLAFNMPSNFCFQQTNLRRSDEIIKKCWGLQNEAQISPNHLHFCFFSVCKETKPLQRHHEKQSSEDIPLNCKTESTNMPQSESR